MSKRSNLVTFKFVMFTGSRSIPDSKSRPIVGTILDKYDPKTTVIIVGDATGVDTVVKNLAVERGFIVLLGIARGAWKTFGKGGGLMRNSAMVDLASEGHAIWDGESRGTTDSIKKLRAAGKKVNVVTVSV